MRDWLSDGNTDGWEGHDADALDCNPSDDEIRNGGYRVVMLDRDVDTLASLAEELRELGWGNAQNIAAELDALVDA